MDPELLTWLVQNFDKLGVGLLLFLIVAVFGYLFFAGKLESPRSVGRLHDKITALEKDCGEKDALALRAATELADARVNYTKVATAIEYMEKDAQRCDRDAQECKRDLQQARIEVAMRDRFSTPKPEGQV